MNGSLPQNIVVSLVQEMEKQWLDLERQLLSVAQEKDFSIYLQDYRGISEQSAPNARRCDVGRRISDSFLSCITHCLQVSVQSLQCDETRWAQILKWCEGSLNLALYFWHAPNERNFQFRTVVHFTAIDQEPVLVSTSGLPDFFVRMTEWGVQISATDQFEPFPFRCSVALGCQLSDVDWKLCSEVPHAAKTLARIRVVQREFCQLIDEWEHSNSILAHKQFSLKRNSSSEQIDAQQKIFEISRSRNSLALWCSTSTADFQAFVSEGLSTADLHSDLKAELLATDSLLLSGFQKFFLPASVSRHVYSSDVIESFSRFTRERLRADPDDLYCVLSQISFALALGNNPDWQSLLTYLESKSFRWSLSADPSAAIKSVAWAYSAQEHQLITACFILALHAKSEPNKLESYWLQCVAALIEMPETFVRKKNPPRSFGLSQADCSNLLERAVQCFAHFDSDTQSESKETARYVCEFLRSEMSLQ